MKIIDYLKNLIPEKYKPLINYIIVINIIAFFTFGLDKHKAINRKRRIPELTLMTLCVLGGGIGCFLGMKFFHHKTRKIKFFLGIPLITIIEIGFICLWFIKG